MRGELGAFGDELPHHHFTIDEVLGTAQTDETDFQACVPALGEDLHLGYYCGGRRVSRYITRSSRAARRMLMSVWWLSRLLKRAKLPLGEGLQSCEDFSLH